MPYSCWKKFFINFIVFSPYMAPVFPFAFGAQSHFPQFDENFTPSPRTFEFFKLYNVLRDFFFKPNFNENRFFYGNSKFFEDTLFVNVQTFDSIKILDNNTVELNTKYIEVFKKDDVFFGETSSPVSHRFILTSNSTIDVLTRFENHSDEPNNPHNLNLTGTFDYIENLSPKTSSNFEGLFSIRGLIADDTKVPGLDHSLMLSIPITLVSKSCVHPFTGQPVHCKHVVVRFFGKINGEHVVLKSETMIVYNQNGNPVQRWLKKAHFSAKTITWIDPQEVSWEEM